LGGSQIDAAGAQNRAAFEKQLLGQGRFTGVNMRDDANVGNALLRYVTLPAFLMAYCTTLV